LAVSYESIRFGRHHAAALRRRPPQPGDKWQLYEAFFLIRGKLHDLWRAVDRNGMVPHILVQKHRDTDTAVRFFQKLLRSGIELPRVIGTDRLKSYAATQRHILPKAEAGISTTEQRFHISRRNDANGRCSVSSRPARHHVSYPPIAAFIITFSFAATSLLLPITALRDTLLSVSGVM
jgi:transposase-like protein